MKKILSICMMVKDEEKNIRRCCESVKNLCNSIAELIIVDTGSSDNTVSIAKEYTDKVYFHKWNNNFSEMRNITISYATGEWIFILDADEEVLEEDKLKKYLLDKNINKNNTIICNIRNYNDLNDESTVAITPSPRFFKNDGEFKYLGSVHNQPIYKNPIHKINLYINHYGYNVKDKELMEKKFIRTKGILEKELKSDPENIYYIFQLGVSYDMHNESAKAYDIFKRAYDILSRKSNNEKYKNSYLYGAFSRCANIVRKFEVSREICTEGITVRNDYIDLYYLRGINNFMLFNYKEAIMDFEKYFDLLSRFDKLEISQDLSISSYNIEDGFQNTARINLISCYLKEKEYKKALVEIDKLKNIGDKRVCINAIIKYLKQEDILELYKKMDFNNRQMISEIIENKYIESNKDLNKNIRYELSKINDIYGDYNKILIEEDIDKKSELINNFLSLHDLNNNESFYSMIIEISINNDIDISDFLKKISFKSNSKFIQYLINNKSVDNNNFIEAMTDKIKTGDLSQIKFFNNYLYEFLLANKADANIQVIIKYILLNIKYITSIYKEEVLLAENMYLLTDRERFCLYIYEAFNYKNTDVKYSVDLLKNALIIEPQFKDIIKLLSNIFIENSFINNEMDQCKKQFKNIILNLLMENKLEEAKNNINEYNKILDRDEDIIFYEEYINILY
jgi:glycosyltransferase involved in cell wall biosynthesis